MIISDNFVVANINNKNKILIVNEKEKSDKGFNINAYDLQCNKYILEYDLACFNGKTGKGYFDYYLNGKLLKPLTKYNQVKDGDVISINNLKQIENKLNVKENENAM